MSLLSDAEEEENIKLYFTKGERTLICVENHQLADNVTKEKKFKKKKSEAVEKPDEADPEDEDIKYCKLSEGTNIDTSLIADLKEFIVENAAVKVDTSETDETKSDTSEKNSVKAGNSDNKDTKADTDEAYEVKSDIHESKELDTEENDDRKANTDLNKKTKDTTDKAMTGVEKKESKGESSNVNKNIISESGNESTGIKELEKDTAEATDKKLEDVDDKCDIPEKNGDEKNLDAADVNKSEDKDREVSFHKLSKSAKKVEEDYIDETTKESNTPESIDLAGFTKIHKADKGTKDKIKEQKIPNSKAKSDESGTKEKDNKLDKKQKDSKKAKKENNEKKKVDVDVRPKVNVTIGKTCHAELTQQLKDEVKAEILKKHMGCSCKNHTSSNIHIQVNERTEVVRIRSHSTADGKANVGINKLSPENKTTVTKTTFISEKFKPA